MNSQNWLGVLVGGFGTAFCFAFLNTIARANTRVGLGPSVTMAGTGVLLVGTLLWIFVQDKTIGFRSGTMSLAMGILWATGFACITISLTWLGAPLSQISSIFNGVSIVLSVLLAMVIFQEWKEFILSKLFLGIGFIIIGIVLVLASKVPKG